MTCQPRLEIEERLFRFDAVLLEPGADDRDVVLGRGLRVPDDFGKPGGNHLHGAGGVRQKRGQAGSRREAGEGGEISQNAVGAARSCRREFRQCRR